MSAFLYCPVAVALRFMACCSSCHAANSRLPSSLSKYACISGNKLRARASSSWSGIVKEDDCNDNSDDTIKAEKKERSKIGNIIAYILPYLKSTCIQKIVQTCMADIVRWNDTVFKDHIANNGFGNNG